MDATKKKTGPKAVFEFISTIISWTIFALLLLCVILLLYYFISTKIYATKGEKYEPKFSLYTIISPSMVPNIDVYDVVVNFRVDSPQDVQIGDVITFISESTESMGATVTHRVVSIERDDEGNYSYQTKGDNNLIEDSSSVPYGNIIGIVSLRIPQLGRVQAFVASSYGWLFLILLPAVYVIGKDLIRLLKLLIGEEKLKKSKVLQALNRPLLLGRKPKLLPEPKIMETVPATDIVHPIIDSEHSIAENELPVVEDNNSVNNYQFNTFVDDDDEIDLDDMPTLK